MLGVVLWSDSAARKAVIWCEDHGDLAYYTGGNETEIGHRLDEGDLVRFDLRVADRMRYASNPRIIESKGAPGLRESLRGDAPGDDAATGSGVGSNVVSLDRSRRRAACPPQRASGQDGADRRRSGSGG